MAFNHNFTRHLRIQFFLFISFALQISKACLILFGNCSNIGELNENENGDPRQSRANIAVNYNKMLTDERKK